MFAATLPSDPSAPIAAKPQSTLARADGGAALGVGASAGRLRLTHLDQRSPWRVLFPRTVPGDLPLGVMVNTGGGLCGGDRARQSVAVGEDANLVVTSQAAEKVYRSLGPDTVMQTALTVARGGWLEWMPQETILFDAARFRRQLSIDVADSGRLLAGETMLFGRHAHGETWTQGLAADQWRVRYAGRLVWADGFWLSDDVADVMASPAGFGGGLAMATAVAVGPGAAALIDGLRARQDDDAGGRFSATVVNDVLIWRRLDDDAKRLRGRLLTDWAWLRSAWTGLPERVPRPWLI